MNCLSGLCHNIYKKIIQLVSCQQLRLNSFTFDINCWIESASLRGSDIREVSPQARVCVGGWVVAAVKGEQGGQDIRSYQRVTDCWQVRARARTSTSDRARTFVNVHGCVARPREKMPDRHRIHAKNENTLCASLTMRRELVATRRAGVSTSVVTEIAPRGVHHMVAHARYQWDMTWKVCSARRKLLEYKGKH